MSLRIETEANRCLNCKKPQCTEYCPVHTPIPQVIQKFKANKVMEAGEQLFENNPMSVVCATVCNHEAQCAGHCVLGKKDTPVQFYDIERFVSDAYLSRMRPVCAPKNGKRVAVIGSGPAGLTVAVILAKNGYGVTIFERKNDIGGMLRYGIPEFRLSNTVIDRYKKLLGKLDIQVRLNTTIGGALKIDDLLRDGYDSVFVGTGAWRPRTLNIRGECLANVHFGVSYLENPAHHELGETVAVIGMGNVAMDVARTAFRYGAQRVMLFSRGIHASASSHEMSYAKLDGAEFVYGKQIVRIEPEGPVFKTSIIDENGKIAGYEEGEELVPADSVVIAVSQRPKDKLILSTEHLEGTAKGLLVVDEDFMTTHEGVFAAGDVVTGPLTVVHAVEDAKKTAAAMMRYMTKSDR
ncbi:MAG: NAD(P)-dependent oxidoreductase [Lachnospiraceae bacterium]|nr:NAD(P)-dependent oxidoreductase [Ruminococcus sp.]MCM1274276.1 NAD(P)-dependent oxidoreductase [Lachnospiraceae bacterium]